MNALQETAEQRELWKAMDIVIGATPQTQEQATPSVEDVEMKIFRRY